ncbi:hypothetical protein Mgra_00001620 [Meloidogyne graminicola]|uniref:BHLH domain-containing protein n=1 Tax=Meloidogyne graminicola TaxID=189291 RepID=A0A8S9ZZS3_9BILA|nr:hypothetical protein Mgra_00001620 [Meloidogyne graminicola]
MNQLYKDLINNKIIIILLLHSSSFTLQQQQNSFPNCSSFIQTQISNNLIIPSFINSFVEKPPFTNSLYFWPQEFGYNCGKTEMAKMFGFNEIKYKENKLIESSLNENNLLKNKENNLNNQSNKTIKQLKRINIRREGVNNNRRYKTPSPQLLRLQYFAANARERRRMNHLNKAFEQLRKVLPTNIEEGRRLSKFETLLCAQEYIIVLSIEDEEICLIKKYFKQFILKLAKFSLL